MASTRVIDADGHVMEDEGIWNFIPSPIKERGPKPARANKEGVLRFGNSLFPDLDHLKAGQGIHQNTHGGFNYVTAEEWVQFLDDVGIELTVLYPTQALSYGRINSGEWAGLVTKAYNDWRAAQTAAVAQEPTNG